jgi:hypothetical protein
VRGCRFKVPGFHLQSSRIRPGLELTNSNFELGSCRLSTGLNTTFRENPIEFVETLPEATRQTRRSLWSVRFVTVTNLARGGSRKTLQICGKTAVLDRLSEENYRPEGGIPKKSPSPPSPLRDLRGGACNQSQRRDLESSLSARLCSFLLMVP